MNLLKNKELLKSLLKQIDIFNTINGGASMPAFEVVNNPGNMVIKVSAPGVPSESYHIWLDHLNLSVLAFMMKNVEEVAEGGDNAVNIPMFVRTFQIPPNVDTDNIEAFTEEGVLRIILPYKGQDKLQRQINVKHL